MSERAKVNASLAAKYLARTIDDMAVNDTDDTLSDLLNQAVKAEIAERKRTVRVLESWVGVRSPGRPTISNA